MLHLSLTVLATPLALCRFAPIDSVPEWTALALTFMTISRTADELSIVADQAAVPAHVNAERGYRALRVDGSMPLALVGVLAALANPLAEAGVPIFPIATYDRDYVLVRNGDLAHAIAVLGAAGHLVVVETASFDENRMIAN